MRLEFIELPFLKLGTSGKIRTGAGFNSSDFTTEGVPLIKIGNIKNNLIDIIDCSFISENEKKINLTKEDDLLIAMRGATSGKLGIVSSQFADCFYVGSIGNLGKINDELIYRPFIKYIEQQLYDILKTEAKGTATPMVSIGMLEKFKLIIPKTKEQQKYLFELLENRKKQVVELSTELTHQLTLAKKLRQQLLQDAVQGKLVEQNPKDEPASELLKKIKAEKQKLIAEKKLKKEKELPPIKPEEIPFEIPGNWVWCRLGEISYITSGSTPAQTAFVESGIPYLKMYNLRNQKIDFFHKPQYIKEEVHNGQLKRCRAYSGDIIMNIVGPPLGKIAIIPDDLPECNFNQAAVLIRPLIKEMNQFIFWYLNELSEIRAIETKGVAGQDNISVTQAHNMRVPLPPFAEQNRIVQKVDELMHCCNELEASIKQSESQNEKLLQQVLREALRKEPVGV